MTRRSFLLQLATNQVDDYAAHAVSLSLVKLKMLQKGIEWRLDISEQIGHQGMLMMLMPYQMKLRSTSRTMTAAEARMKSESSIVTNPALMVCQMLMVATAREQLCNL